MSLLWPVLGFVALQRLAELAYALRNTARLLAAGGIESGRGHYPLLVMMHAAWWLALALLVPPDQPANLWLLGLFAILQGLRVWILLSLGERWTTRIITLPGAPLIRSGPYRWLRHPNYLVVVAEIAVLPLAFGAWQIALVFSLLNGVLLAHRIRVENRALAG